MRNLIAVIVLLLVAGCSYKEVRFPDGTTGTSIGFLHKVEVPKAKVVTGITGSSVEVEGYRSDVNVEAGKLMLEALRTARP